MQSKSSLACIMNRIKYKAFVPFSLPLSPPLQVSKFQELTKQCDEVFKQLSELSSKLPRGILEVIGKLDKLLHSKKICS